MSMKSALLQTITGEDAADRAQGMRERRVWLPALSLSLSLSYTHTCTHTCLSVRTQPLTATGAPAQQTSTIPYHTIPYTLTCRAHGHLVRAEHLSVTTFFTMHHPSVEGPF